jgi:WD40 repeat protein
MIPLRFLVFTLCAALLVFAASTPVAAAPRPEMVLQIGHNGNIARAALSPSGQTIATAGEDAQIKLWNTQTGELKRTLEGEWVSDIAWSQSGSTLLGSGYRHLQVWDARSGKLLRKWPIGSGSFSPVAKTLAVAKYDNRAASVELWDTQTGEFQRVLGDETLRYASAIAWSPDASTIAVSDYYTGKVFLWRPTDGALLKTINFRPRDLAEYNAADGSNSFALSVLAFSPDASLLAAAGPDAIRIADTKTGRITRKIKHPVAYEQTQELLFSRGDSVLFESPEGKAVRLWDFKTGSLFGHLYGTSHVQSLNFAGNESTLLLAGQEPGVGLWDARSGKAQKLYPLAQSWRPALRSFEASPDARWWLFNNWHDQGALWDAQKMQRLPFAASGEFLRGAPPLLLGAREQNLEWRRVPSGALWKKLAIPTSPKARDWQRHIKAIATTRDGKTLAVFTFDALLLCDARSGKIERKLAGRETPISQASFSRDGRFLAAGGGEEHGVEKYGERGTITIWDLKSKSSSPLHTLNAYNGVRALAWSPDGSTLAVGCGNEEGSDEWGEVQLWDAPSGRLKRYLLGHGAPLTDLSWSARDAGGSTLLSASRREIKAWHLPREDREGTLQPVWTISEGTMKIHLLPGDKKFLMANQSSEIQVRSVRDGALRASLLTLPPQRAENHAMPLFANWIFFTPSGYYTGSPGVEKFIRWRVDEKLFPAAKYSAQYHRPGKVRETLLANN